MKNKEKASRAELVDAINSVRNMIDVSLIRTSKKTLERWTALAERLEDILRREEKTS